MINEALMQTLGVGVDEARSFCTTLEDLICCFRRQHPEMIDTLDDRMNRQKRMAESILKKKGINITHLLSMRPKDVEDSYDEEIILCYHILRDVSYIDNLR